MTAPAPVPADLFVDDDFLTSIRPDDFVYFLCNIGDGDAQVVLLPVNPTTGERQAVIVDAGQQDKVPPLIRALADKALLPAQNGTLNEGAIALVVATHPHLDHIGGIPEVLTEFKGSIAEFWDPGYFHTLLEYHQMMRAIEEQSSLIYAQPTSGFRRWIGNVAITTLSPSIILRNRFDSYGTEINDASISLRFEFPASRVIQLDEHRNYEYRQRRQSLVLGADAQTLSWSFALTDFPYLHASHSAAAKAIKAATGSDPLRADVMKISHHGSKHGINLELIERVSPKVTLISSVGGGGSYRFPHTVAQELIREAIEKTTSSGKPRSPDHELGIFYTSDKDSEGKTLGSIALVMGRGDLSLWRFGDSSSGSIDLTKGRRWTG